MEDRDSYIKYLKIAWRQGHHILFTFKGTEMLMYLDGKRQILCDDGRKCSHRVIDTEGDIFEAAMPDGTTVLQLLTDPDSELKYIY